MKHSTFMYERGCRINNFLRDRMKHFLGQSYENLLCIKTNLWDRIKGLKLRHFGKVNFTYHGKLRHRSRSSTAAIYIAAMAAVYGLVYCGDDTFIYIAAAVDEALKSLLSTAASHLLRRLWGRRQSAAVWFLLYSPLFTSMFLNMKKCLLNNYLVRFPGHQTLFSSFFLLVF